MGPITNLISGAYHSCERKKYAFIILQEFTIIFPNVAPFLYMVVLKIVSYYSTINVNALFLTTPMWMLA